MSQFPDDVQDLFSPAARVDELLRQWLAQAELPANLRGAIEYSLLSGGKRLRPILAWHSCIAAGGDGSASLPAGAALELIHAFSLVHDDLPALDNDDLRRGRPTLHRHTSEAMAILAGDAMLASAAQLLIDRAPASHASFLASNLLRATNRMISGQVLDTLGDPRPKQTPDQTPDQTPERRLETIHLGKTAALITAACEMGAASAMTNPTAPDVRPLLDRFVAFGTDIGLMFQVVDDLIDVEQTAAHTGKRTGKDAGAGKLTYPSILGIDRSRAKVYELRNRALAQLEPFGTRAIFAPTRAVLGN